MERDETEERLERLLAATAGARASSDFTARVMGAVEREPAPGAWYALPRAAKLVMPIAAIAAGVAVVWAIHAAHDVDDASLAPDDVVSTLYASSSEAE